MDRISTVFGRLKLLLLLIRVNLRRSSTTVIGLAIAVSIIAAFVIYLETDKTNFYLEMLEEPEFDGYSYRYRAWDKGISPSSGIDILSRKETLENKINESNLNGIVIPHLFSPSFESRYHQYFMNQSDTVELHGITIDESILNDCIEGSALPTTFDEVILYNPTNITLILGEKLNITKRYYPYPQSDVRKKYNFTLIISGIITPESITGNSPLKDLLFSSVYPTFITDIEKYISLLQTMDSELKLLTTSSYPFTSTIHFLYGINSTVITERNVVSVVHNLHSYMRDTSWSFDLEEYSFSSSGRAYYYTLSGKINEFNSLFLVFMIFSVPVFIITLFLINFSLGIINENREKGISLFKMRGLSSSFIFLILTFETLVISLIATILGVIIGIPFSILMTITKGFLEFDTNLIPNKMIISLDNLRLIFLLGFIIAVLAHLRTIVRLAKAGVSELDQEASKKKKRRPSMIRGNVDIFLLTQGILGTLLLTLLMNTFPKANIGTVEGIAIFLPIILILMLFSPLSMLIGFIFAFHRFIPLILHHLGSVFWRKDWRLIAVATRNLTINARITKRTTLLIACTISFLMILSMVPNSILQHSINTKYYNAGSDIRIFFERSQFNLSELGDLTSRLDNTPSLNATRISRLDYSFTEDSEHKRFDILGIDDNFADIAFWKNIYDDKSLDGLVSSLYASSQNNPVIIDSVSSSLENLKVTDKYAITSGSESERVEVTIEGITDYWPSLILRQGTRNRFLITTRSSLYNLTVNMGFGVTILDEQIWCKILSGYELDETIQKIQNLTADFGISPSAIRSTAKTVSGDIDSRISKFLWIIANFNYITALGVTLIVIILFIVTRISSQATELGLSRALGMKYNQIFILMFFEPLLLFLISGIPGGIFGTLLIMNFVNFGAPMFNYGPPLTLSFNFFSIFLIYGSIFIVILISGFITSLVATRANISQILKVE